MYKVDFDSFFIQLQCPFLYHASVETYLTNYLGSNSVLTIVKKIISFWPQCPSELFHGVQNLRWTKYFVFLNTEILIISTI